ncbi:MAG TPA: hypothetical protein VK911_18100, partial [Vicinamibacterales bacterium]|nr:hypothetical protein [Vicinamibacterales bacterium]
MKITKEERVPPVLRRLVVTEPLSRRIVIGLLIGAAASTIRFLLDPLLGGDVPYLLQAAAAVISTWVAGYAGGAAAGVIGIVSTVWLPATLNLRLTIGQETAGLVVFAFILMLLVLQVGR